MATTTPDNLFTPNPSDNYNLLADWATSMQSVQAALAKRGNLYVGTAAQRAAFTSSREGTHWQDTDGPKYEWVRKAGVWRGANPLGGSVSVAGAANETRVVIVTVPAGYFATQPSVAVTMRTSNPQNGSISVIVDSETQFSIRLRYTTTTTVPVSWIATESNA